MKQKQETTTFDRVIKQIRDDIEDGKLDSTIKELEKQYPTIFLKAKVLSKNKPLQSPLKDLSNGEKI